MKQRYGVAMTYGHILPGATRLSRQTSSLSKAARQRLKWMDWYAAHKQHARATCRHFGLSPDVFYRWKHRYRASDLTSLEDHKQTRTPHKQRVPVTDPALVQRIRYWRERRPRWGKKKIWKLVSKEGFGTSISTVGRTLDRLRTTGQLNEPAIVVARLAGIRRRRYGKRPYAIRKPWGYPVHHPGDLVEVDTVHVYPVPGERRYQFTAADCIAKHTARVAGATITATNAQRILTAIAERFPYPVKAIQIDGGSEFKAGFEQACQERGIRLFVLPVRSPKLNGMVERMQRTSREEIYDLRPMPLTVAEHNELLVEEDHIYNYIRPHDALDLLTPDEYYQANKTVT
ncbi:transposase [Candidatus Berkelbacteria bacterium]|nr:transposase [Candidatus Berkelbacteria bacterium]